MFLAQLEPPPVKHSDVFSPHKEPTPSAAGSGETDIFPSLQLFTVSFNVE